MPHIKQIAGCALADQPMIGSDGRQPHPFIPTVDQYAGFAQIRRQAMNMRIVDPQQHRGLGLRFIHAGKKQVGVAVVLIQRAVAQAHFMRRQRVIDTLDHPVVEDIRSLIECALRGKHQQMIEQQTPGGQPCMTPSSRAQSSTARRALSLVFAFPARTRETVLGDSPVRAAISATRSFLSIL